ncbi:MAG: sigma-70 family RNA polymerase sigma factor [Chloroflexi bacterium]|nr:MAG: sigma-70 family RNA polymerase sigma factor [Chloroflexota bacterium]
MTQPGVDVASPSGQPAPAAATSRPDLEAQLERHRVELTAYCYRMLGSTFEAEDAVQETFIRAWRGLDRFEGRAALRSWLYRIATNVCLNMLGASQRRARPMDLTAPQSADTPLPIPLTEATWIEPIPDARVVPTGGDPAEVAEARESVRLAFVSALQHLPPRQRAVLILREVLAWRAEEVAELLETSVASVNSALQRARATMASTKADPTDPVEPDDEAQRELLARYVDAFERYDMDSLTALLHEDATWSMPPYDLWLQTHDDIRAWCLGTGIGCKGSRLIPTIANGSPSFGQYKPAADGNGLEPWSVQVLEIADGRIAGISFFLDTARFFPLFGLPLHLDA